MASLPGNQDCQLKGKNGISFIRDSSETETSPDQGSLKQRHTQGCKLSSSCIRAFFSVTHLFELAFSQVM